MARQIDRLNAEIQKVVSGIINNEINDPRINGVISVLRVDITKDLSFATINLSIYNDNPKETFEAIEKASGYIRKLLSQKIEIRSTPKLIFKLDDGIAQSDKIHKIIKDLNIT